jgi:hypothetical protein
MKQYHLFDEFVGELWGDDLEDAVLHAKIRRKGSVINNMYVSGQDLKIVRVIQNIDRTNYTRGNRKTESVLVELEDGIRLSIDTYTE